MDAEEVNMADTTLFQKRVGITHFPISIGRCDVAIYSRTLHYILRECTRSGLGGAAAAAAHSGGGFVATYILHCNALRIIPLLLLLSGV